MDPSARASQPGREVRNTYDTDTVVVDSRTGHWTAPFHDGSGHSYAAISEPNGAIVGNNKASNTAGINEAYEGRHDGIHSAQQPGRGRRFPWLLFGIGGLVVLVLGGVVGGIAGWRVVAN